MTCGWFSESFAATPNSTKGHSVAECAANEVALFQALVPTEQCFPPIGIVNVQLTYFVKVITESPAFAQIWVNGVGDGSVYCPNFSRYFRTTNESRITRNTGETVGGVVSWTNSCAGTGLSLQPSTGHCGSGATIVPPKCPECPKAGNPVNIGSGAKVQKETDYIGTGPFPLQLTRRYTSGFERASTMGRSWRHSYDVRIVTITPGATVVVQRPDGREFVFTNNAGVWTSDVDVNGKLELVASTWRYTTGAGDAREADSVEVFDASWGRLTSITNRAGLTQALTYSTASTPPAVASQPALLISVADPFGRALSFAYDKPGRLIKVTDPDGGTIQMAYTAGEQLSTVTYQDGKVRTFLYNESANTGGANLPRALTGIVDENGSRFATWQYNAAGLATLSEHAGGAGRVTVTYNANSTTTVTDSLGKVQNFGLGNVFGVVRQTSVPGPCAGCGDSASSTFGANGNVSSRTDFNGNRTNYTYLTPRNLEATRVEGLTAAGATTAQTRTTSTQWHATFVLPAQVAEPLRITTFVYNGDGGVTCGATGALCSKTVQATTGRERGARVRRGSRRHAADLGLHLRRQRPGVDHGRPANGCGRRDHLHVLPDQRPSCGQARQRCHHRQCAGPDDEHYLLQRARSTAHDHGSERATTTLAYDTRLRLVSRTVGGEVTSYEYDNAGQLTKVTLPDSSYLTYTYDPAHRLTAVQDNLGNKIAYTLDLMGQPHAGAGVRPRQHARADAHPRVLEPEPAVPGAGRFQPDHGVRLRHAGQRHQRQGPAQPDTANQYDALNRLKQMTDPASGVTLYAYNGLDALTTVTDPRSLATNYTVGWPGQPHPTGLTRYRDHGQHLRRGRQPSHADRCQVASDDLRLRCVEPGHEHHIPRRVEADLRL